MMTGYLLLAILAAGAPADPVPAPEPKPSDQVVVTAKPDRKLAYRRDDEFHGNPNRTICRVEEELGTRLGGKRTCRTAAEWARGRRETRQNVDRAQNGKWSQN